MIIYIFLFLLLIYVYDCLEVRYLCEDEHCNGNFNARYDIKSYIIDYIKENNFSKILEIGPGGFHRMFPLSTHIVEYNSKEFRSIPNLKIYNIDIDTEKVPENKYYFDFIYCRHVLEDINNPKGAFQEIVRLSKRGYIETPSPLVESVYVFNVSHHLEGKGYAHHRFLLWTDSSTNTLYAIPKFPIINNLHPSSEAYDTLYHYLQNYNGAFYNNYYYWDIDNEKFQPNIIVLTHGIDFDFLDYMQQIMLGCQKSFDHSKIFFELIINPYVIKFNGTNYLSENVDTHTKNAFNEQAITL